MDLTHRDQDDFLSTKGFLLSIRDVLRIQPGGLFWAGHPCNPLHVGIFQRGNVFVYVYIINVSLLRTFSFM